MKKLTTLILLLLLQPFAFILGSDQPNIIFMLSDDQGWTETSVQMHPDIPNSKSDIVETPNLLKLAKQGMRFSQAYAPAPVCSPTRLSLQTGKSPAQNQWTKASRSYSAADGFKLIPPQSIRNIPDDELTIGELLQEAGYATAHYGKWHIAGGGPERHGYDESDGDTSNGDAAPHKGDNPVDIFGMGNRAAKFMQKNIKTDKPFFIQLSYHALHYPQNAKPATVAKYRKLMPNGDDRSVGRAAIGENLDEGIGLKRLINTPRSQLTDKEMALVTLRTQRAPGRLPIDFTALFEKGVEEHNIVLKDEDVIRVPRFTASVMVNGAVLAPAAIPFNESYAVHDYIERAGGFSPRAKKGDIVIVQGRSGNAVELAKVPRIEPGDAIYVPEKLPGQGWRIFRESLTILTNVATLILIIQNTRR